MTDMIELKDFPADEAEVFALHFESIRRKIWILGHLGAGSAPLDYDEGMDLTEWQAYVDGFESDAPCFPAQAGESTFKNLLFTRPTIGGNWLCTFIGEDYTQAQIRSAFPFNAAGTLVGPWAYGLDVNRYADWDQNSSREDAYRDTKPGSAGFWSMHAPSRDWMPKQVLASKQNTPVKYTNTSRIIPRRTLDVEFARTYITDPDSMGPTFEVIAYQRPASSTTVVTKVVDGYEIGLFGYQYGCSGGHPYNDGGNTGEDISPFTDPKIRPAYQNQVERICCANTFGWPVRAGNAWSDTFIANYKRMYWDAGEDLYYNPIPGPAPEWDSGETYTAGMKVAHNNIHWLARQTSQGVTPEPGASWEWIGQIPDFASIHDECWGCNMSGFELLLWIYGEYDWYFCTSFPYVPTQILKARFDLANLADPPTQEEIDAEYPLPVGTWRRTWRRSMGAPKDDMSMMWPKTKTGMDYIAQEDYPGTGSALWFGTFNDEVPTITLTESEQAEIDERHGPTITADGECYELHRDIVTDMWELLEMLKYNYSTATIQAATRNANETSTVNNVNLTTWSYDAAVANIGAWNVGSLSGGAGVNCTATYRETPSPQWLESTWLTEDKLVVTGGLEDGRLAATHASLLFKLLGGPYLSGVNYPEPHDYVLALPDGGTVSVEMYDDGLQNPNTTLKYCVCSFPIESTTDTTIDVPLGRVGDVPVPDFPWEGTLVYPQMGYMVSRVSYNIQVLDGYDGLLLTLDFTLFPSTIWTDIRHPTPVAVAVDDTHFNDDGIWID